MEFANHGAAVVVNYNSSEDAATGVVEKIEEEGGEACALQADVAEKAAVDELAADVHREFGPVDILVNNAGITIDRRFDELTRDDWDRVLDVNLGGAFNCTKAFYEDLKQAEHGRLINISSIIGQQGNIGQANYAASKSGLSGLTKSLALELADCGTTANCVAPGFTRTDMLDDVPPRVRKKLLEQIPLERFAEPADVAGVVRYLASNEASYITGQVLEVAGGIRR